MGVVELGRGAVVMLPSRSMLYLKVVFLEGFQPPRYLALWVFKVQQPHEGSMVGPNEEVAAVLICPEVP